MRVCRWFKEQTSVSKVLATTNPEIKMEKKNHAHTHSFIHKKQVGYSVSLVRLWQDQTTPLEGSKNRKSSAKSKARISFPKVYRGQTVTNGSTAAVGYGHCVAIYVAPVELASVGLDDGLGQVKEPQSEASFIAKVVDTID
ncbi:hypothetical protein Tco_1102840 [Tanacetum coccineum]